MVYSQKIKHFIEKQIVLGATCLPQNYPSADSLEDFQAGYKHNAITGEKLTGDGESDFKENWYVICTNRFDDPFFVDFSEGDKNFPVYFASSEEEGVWTPIRVSSTISEFGKILFDLSELESDIDDLLDYMEENIDLENELWSEVFDEYADEENEDEE